MDMLIRETLRIAQPHTAMRRNMGPETYIDGKVIPTGTLVVFPFSNVHLNPALYPDPWRFDPTRPHHKADFAYLGWGGGTSSLLFACFATCQAEPCPAAALLREGDMSWLADSEIDDKARHGAAAPGV
jgi:cytochrome P450